MKYEKVTCDSCGRDITYTGNSVDYRLLVTSEGIHSRGSGAVTDMMIYPTVDRPYNFCDLRCLQKHSIATGKPRD